MIDAPHNTLDAGGDRETVADKSRLKRARQAARAAIVWERLWPVLMPFAMVVALFVAASLFGLWPRVSDSVRYLGLAAFAAGAVWALLLLRGLRVLPTSTEVDARIERVSLLSHRPVTAQADNRADVGVEGDSFTRALWAEHRRRAASQLGPLRSGKPDPQVSARDPYALRAVAVLLLFMGAAAGWGQWGSRMGDAFRSHVVVAEAETGRIDAWVTPPAYTNRPPITLTRAGSSDEGRLAVSVPEGSELVIRVLGVDQPSVTVGGVLLDPDGEADTKDAASTTYKTTLEREGAVELKSGEALAARWQFEVIADENPTIAFEGEPTTATRGALELSYRVGDDYGVASARAIVEQALPAEQMTAGREPRPLVEAPEIALGLPRRNAKDGVAKISKDLTSHAWAGAEIELTLEATDQAGQLGVSEAVRMTLPERVFIKPLAQAIVFERRRLALDANTSRRVARMLGIITDTRPDIFLPDVGVYTSLRVAQKMIARARFDDIEEGDKQLREAMDLLWEIALKVEDGDLSAAERRLRDAQERLAEALENGATDEEIERLMDELRQAMSEFMQQMAEQMQRQQQNQQAMPMDPNTQVMRQQDLERMMQQIEDLAKSGSKDAARQLLEELQRMMNNLQTAQPQQQQQQGQDEFSEQMNKLSEMMRQQQQLMDETFQMQRQQQQQNQQGQQQQQQQGQQNQQQQQQGQQQQGQQQQGEGQQPMTAEELAEALKQLQKRQGELQQQMDETMQALREQGLDPGKLGEAGEAMGQAEGELGQGETGEATGQQGRALQAMREGAQQMMQNMQNQAGEQGRRGERGQHGQQTRGERDPLGRQSRSRGPQLGDETQVPDEIDAQRAREILEAIRERLGEQFRPSLELDYLDRLLPTR